MVEAARAMRERRARDRHDEPHIPHATISSYEGVVPKTDELAHASAAAARRRASIRVADRTGKIRRENIREDTHEDDVNHAAALAAVLLLGAAAAHRREDTLKLAVGQRGNWDTSVSEVGQRAGIFKKHGLELEIVYTQGAGETQQAVISGSVDIGVAAGVMGVLSAYSKGAPVRVIGAETTGADDLYWYVKADSPIKSLKDTDGKTLAYSTNGSSTHGIVTAFMKQYDLKAKPTAMGGPAAKLTAVMSGQIDVGWAAPPFGLDQLDKKANPHHRDRQRRRGVQGPDRAAQHRQRELPERRTRTSSTAT